MGTPHRVRTRRFRVAVAGRHAPARGRSWVGAEIRHAQRPARRSAGPAQARPAGPARGPSSRHLPTSTIRCLGAVVDRSRYLGLRSADRRGPAAVVARKGAVSPMPGPGGPADAHNLVHRSNGPSPSTAAASVPLSRRLPNPSRSPPRRRSRPVHPGRPGTGSPTAPGPGMPLSTHCWRPGTAAARSSVSSA